MKQFIIEIVARLGYVLLRADEWQDYKHEIKARAAAQLREADSGAGAQQSDELAKCKEQLVACAHERHLLNVRMGRAEASVDAFKRERNRLQAELAASREQLSRADLTGRTRELEAEIHRLRVRLADLEVFFKETRRSSATYL